MKTINLIFDTTIASFFLFLPLAGHTASNGSADSTIPNARQVSLLQVGESMASLRPIVLLADPNISALRVTPPPELALQQQGLMAQQATVSINYLPAGGGSWGDNCITWPDQPKAAFTYAASLWASQLQSPVPITIDACWANNLSSGVLGHGGSRNFFRDFSGAPVSNTWYPVASANALHGSDLDPAQSDIYIGYSSTFNWYFGTDGNTPSNQYDFVSVVLHELAHGLGFLGSMQVSNGQGSWGSGSGLSFVYDRFTENGSGQKLIDTTLFPNPSGVLATQLQSNDIYFNGANANAANGGARVPLYAPSTWQAGSSYAHLAESYNGTSSALMTYSLSYGESIHNPGSVTLGLLKDVGWMLQSVSNYYTLTVTKTGAGSGTVTSNPAGIACGATCGASFTSGTSVILTAATATRSTFAGWSGAGCSGTGSCTVTMNAAKTVFATFDTTNGGPPLWNDQSW